jgi:hypothetical protein
MTCTACHVPRAGVSILRLFNSAATACADMPASSARIGRRACARSFASTAALSDCVGAAEFHASALRGGQAGFGALAYEPALFFSERGVDVQHEGVSIGAKPPARPPHRHLGVTSYPSLVFLKS